jgi:N6-adenosine-specific RNA methylase IME4
VRYRTIVADPPWPIAWSASPAEAFTRPSTPGVTRTKPLPYGTMTLEEIVALPIEQMAADDAVLWMWSTRRLFREGEAARAARAWGFEPCGEVLWGLRNPGLGGAHGNDHEPVLIARRGAGRVDTTLPLGVIFWRQPYARGKIHSAKPDGFLDLVEQVSPGPYLELFARRQRLGWDTWGDEALEHVEMRA